MWLLYALVAVQSGAQAINQPARSAIIPVLVRKELLPAANALSMMIFGLTMTAGPLLAGVLVAWVGFGWTYTIDVVSFAFAFWALLKLPSMPPGEHARPAGLRSVVEGFRFLGTRPNLRMTFVIDLVAMIFAQPRALLPAIGALMIGGGEATVGILLASMAVGAFLAGLFSGPLGGVRRQGAAVVWSVMGWGASVAAFGLVVVLAGHSGDDGVTRVAAARRPVLRAGRHRGFRERSLPDHHPAGLHPGPSARAAAGRLRRGGRRRTPDRGHAGRRRD